MGRCSVFSVKHFQESVMGLETASLDFSETEASIHFLKSSRKAVAV